MLLLNFNANRHKKVITFSCLKNRVYIYIEDSEKKTNLIFIQRLVWINN